MVAKTHTNGPTSVDAESDVGSVSEVYALYVQFLKDELDHHHADPASKPLMTVYQKQCSPMPIDDFSLMLGGMSVMERASYVDMLRGGYLKTLENDEARAARFPSLDGLSISGPR